MTAETAAAADTWAAQGRGTGAYADVNGLHLYHETFAAVATAFLA